MHFKKFYKIYLETLTPVHSYKSAYVTVINKIKKVKELYEKFVKICLDNQDYIINDIGAIGIDHYFIQSVKEFEKAALKDGKFFQYSIPYHLRNLSQNFKTSQETDDGDFRYKLFTTYLRDDIERFIKEYDVKEPNYDLRDIRNSIDEFLSEAKNYGFEEKEIEFITRLKDILDEIGNIIGEIKHYKEKIDVLSKWNYGEYIHARKFRPEDLQPIEIAYHASLNAKELFSKGFQTDYKNGSTGLGGSSYKGDISFSLSLDICKTIATSFKEMWLIAHDKWKRASVLEYVKKYTRTEENFKNAMETYLQQKGYSSLPNDKASLIEFYLTSLWFIQSPVSKNPVFANTNGKDWIEKLEKVDYDDIGIIKAKIKTDNASEFLVAEREIRIPPSDIVEFISIIK
jgi:hypothetical protein